MAGFLSRRDARRGYNAAGGENFNSDYRTEKQKLRASGLRGRELRQTARKNVMDDAISKSVGLEDTMNQNLDQMNYEINALADNDMHRLIMQGQQEQRDFSDQLAEEREALKELIKPIQIKSTQTPAGEATSVTTPAGTSVEQAQTPTGEPVKVSTPATEAPGAQPTTVGTPQAADVTVETPAPGQPAQIQSAQVAQPEEPDYNSMSYNDAFRMARKLKGKDGTFEWKGKSYGLKYADEVAAEKAAAAKAKAAGANPKTSTGATAQPSAPVATTTQVASPTTTAQTQVKMQEQVTTPATQVDSSQSSQPSNLTKPATIVARRDSTIQNSSAAPEVTAAQTLQNKDISKP